MTSSPSDGRRATAPGSGSGRPGVRSAPEGRAPEVPAPPSGGATTYVVLDVAGTRYGLDVERALGVVVPGPVTPVPGAPRAIRGVVNVKGRVLPVGDMGVALGGPASGEGSTALLLGPPGAGPADLAVLGEVLDVVEIPPEGIEPPPGFGLGPAAPVVSGVARHGGSIVLILDGERLLAALGTDAAPEEVP